MRRRFAFVSLAALGAVFPVLTHAVDRGEAKATVAGKSVSIDYGRPSMSGRDMLAMLQAGQSWRMGADAATTLKTDADLSFGAAPVPKGEYVLTAKRGADNKWVLEVNKGTTVVATVPLADQKAGASVEVFTIELTGTGNAGTFAMKWGTMSLSAPFTGR